MTDTWQGKGLYYFCYPVQTGFEVHAASNQTGTCIWFSGIEQPGYKADPTAAYAEVKNVCSTPPVLYCVLNWEGELNFTFNQFFIKSILIRLEKYFILVHSTAKAAAHDHLKTVFYFLKNNASSAISLVCTATSVIKMMLHS